MGRYAFLGYKYQLDNFIGISLENLVLLSTYVFDTHNGNINPLVFLVLTGMTLSGLIGFGLINKKRKNK